MGDGTLLGARNPGGVERRLSIQSGILLFPERHDLAGTDSKADGDAYSCADCDTVQGKPDADAEGDSDDEPGSYSGLTGFPRLVWIFWRLICHSSMAGKMELAPPDGWLVRERVLVPAWRSVRQPVLAPALSSAQVLARMLELSSAQVPARIPALWSARWQIRQRRGRILRG